MIRGAAAQSALTRVGRETPGRRRRFVPSLSAMNGSAIMRGSPDQAFQAVLWFAGLVVVLGVAAGAFAWFWSRLRHRDRDAGSVFSLDQLRTMRERGELSAEEFSRLRERAISAFSSREAK